MNKAKQNLESYLQNLPSVDELEKLKAELSQKTDSCRRLQLQNTEMEQKLLYTSESHDKTKEEYRTTKRELENLQLKLTGLETLNISHEKRLQKVKNSDSVDLEVLLHERDKYVE